MKPKRNYSSKKTSKYDNCQTPGYALNPLLELDYFNVKRMVWECAAGKGNLVNYLKGHECFGTDILTKFEFHEYIPEYYDFLNNYQHSFFEEVYDYCIVTNPPYSLKREFTEKCFELGKPWALLMPSETVSTKWFIELFQSKKMKPGIIWFSPRVNFKMPNVDWDGKGAQFPVAWFTWKMGFEGNKYIRMDHWTKEYRKRFEV